MITNHQKLIYLHRNSAFIIIELAIRASIFEFGYSNLQDFKAFSIIWM